MDKKMLIEKKSELAKLVVEGDKLIDKLKNQENKENRKKKTLDNLSYIQGLKSKANILIKKNTELSMRRTKNIFHNYLERASEHVDVTSKLSKSPSFNINYNRQGIIQNFADDLNVRMASVDIENYIKDLKRVRTALLHQVKKLDREIKAQEINSKFEEMKKTIESL